MANNQYVNKVVFGAVSIIDITPTTAIESDVAQGKVFFKADGSQATGTNQGGSEDGSVTQDADGYLVLSDEPGTHVEVGSLSVTQNGTYTAPTGTAYSPVTVNVPSSEPTGIKYVYSDIDGIGAWDVSGYAKCSFDYAPLKDGLARLWIRLVDSSELTVGLYFYYASSTTYTIDWGDGTKETLTGSGHARPSHTYSDIGNYVIEIDNGGIFSNYTMTNGSQEHNTILYGVEANVSGTSKNFAFYYSDNLRKIYFNEGMTTVGQGYVQECPMLTDIHLPNSLTTISASFCRYCTGLKEITIPENVTSIGSQSFGYMDNCVIHMKPTVPPTIQSNTFIATSSQIPSVSTFYVPSASLAAYQSASNWSAYASIMVGE